MQITRLLLGLPVALAGFLNLKVPRDENGLSAPLAHHKRDLGPNQIYLCHTQQVYTFPLCTQDSDCQRPGTKLSNLPPSGLPVPDASFKFGDGYCFHSPQTNVSSCAVKVNPDDDLVGFCNSLLSVWETKVKGLSVIGECSITGDGGKSQTNCDLYCDDNVNPDCATAHTYEFPCAELEVGGPENNTPICPNTKQPPNGAPPAPSNGAPSTPSNGSPPGPGNGAPPATKNGAPSETKNGAPSDTKNGAPPGRI